MTDRYVAIDSPISWSPDSFRYISHHVTVKRFGSMRLTRKVTNYRDTVGTVISEEITDKSKKYRGL